MLPGGCVGERGGELDGGWEDGYYLQLYEPCR